MFLSGTSIFCYSIIIRRKIITTWLQHVTTLKKPNGKSVFPSKCYTPIHVNSAICCPQKSNWLYSIIMIKSGWKSCWNLATTGQKYFVFRRLYPFLPQPLWQCFGPACNLSTLQLYRRCGQALLYDGRGFVGPKKKTTVALFLFNSLSVATF